MKVFISWSGDVSQVFAAALAEWLPNVIQAVEPFFSRDDIRKGAGWLAKLNSELDQSNFGILCVTPDNKDAAWLLFEAGALAKKIEHAHVCPLLLGIDYVQLKGPLSQFQATEATRDDVWKLITSINSALGDDALTESRLSTAFDKNWSDLEAAIKNATDTIAEKQKITGAPKKRSAEDMLEELLNVTRGIGRQLEENRTDAFNGIPGFGAVDRFSEALNPAARGLTGMAASYGADLAKAHGYGITPVSQRAPQQFSTMRPSSPSMRDTPASIGDTIMPISPNEVQSTPIPDNTSENKKK